MFDIDIVDIMKKLATDRPVFHSEADFQFALAWKIKEYTKEKGTDAKITLEKCVNVENAEPMYIDIIVEIDGKEIPIELKYKTRNKSNDPVTINGEVYNLKNQGAQDNGRYDFVKDISRIENYISSSKTKCNQGYAIILTNDHLYWEGGDNSNSKQFVLKNSLAKGKHEWEKISKSMENYNKNRVKEITLNHDYSLEWIDYPDSKNGNSQIDYIFKYLIVKVEK